MCSMIEYLSMYRCKCCVGEGFNITSVFCPIPFHLKCNKICLNKISKTNSNNGNEVELKITLFFLQVSEKNAVAKKASSNIVPIHVTESQEDSVDAVDGNHRLSASSPVPRSTDAQEGNFLKVQREKMRVLFNDIDTAGDDRISKEEFRVFVRNLGVVISEQESEFLFDAVDENSSGAIEYSEFYNYFVKFVLGETSASKVEAHLCSAFLRADRDGSLAISFTEFAEVAMSQSHKLGMAQFMRALKDMDDNSKGAKELYNYINQGGKITFDVTSEEEKEPIVLALLASMYNKDDAAKMAEHINKRWKDFAYMRRCDDKNELVMKGGPGMVADVPPGEYALIHLVCATDLPPIETEHAVVEVTWESSGLPGKSGLLKFPEDFDVELPTVIATNRTLAYYGASLVDDHYRKVKLLYRHGIVDFTIENNYLPDYVIPKSGKGGAGVEKHAFAHLDCPLDKDSESGCFILGKLQGNELHLTAFKVPTRETLYVPPGTIHSNDYLRGTWRTMLSDEAEIDHVHLVKPKGETHEHFHFTFQALM